MKEYKKYFQRAAEPKDVYNALTNKILIEIWTGEDAEMEAVPGTEFSMWDGAICLPPVPIPETQIVDALLVGWIGCPKE